MTHDDIESAVALTGDEADTTHDTPRTWYDDYGWHLSTAEAGDVCLQSVDFDWLDDADDAAIRRLRAADALLSRNEAEAIVDQARSVRSAAESICGALEDAVAAHAARDLAAAKAALLAAYSEEIDHGEASATESLAGRLLLTSRE